MTDQELIHLKIDKLTPEQARVSALEILHEDIDADKASVKRGALISAVLTAGMIIAGMDTIPGYAIMGVDGMFIFNFFQKLQALQQKKKMLKQIDAGTYPGGYKAFLQTCQEYVRNKYKYVQMPEYTPQVEKVEEPEEERKHKDKKGKKK
jgi:hypothetical protein